MSDYNYEVYKQAAKASIEAEQMYRQHARHGLNEIFTDICTHHEDTQLRQESDTDLESARVQHEIELAVKLLEKDILEKQDTLIGLKEQLEEVKAINFEMYQKMQCSEEEAKKRDVNDGQDGKSTQMSACRKPYEERLSSEVWIWYSKCQAEDDHARKLQLKRQISSSDVES
ncbi:hypothetical protein AB205_0163790 [Aquarana catesbeiana]|uniref:Uncharacterized protein n=1 Tax=Aquarana catesbeiana TaxID=8400 RepID=A0A2G9SDA4_AQUCT|nr:hypothetical protein AB205_0163790 [Aquarana catesbeiana]